MPRFRRTSWKWDRGAGRYTTPGIYLLLVTFNVFTPHIFPATWHGYYFTYIVQYLQLHCISACHRLSVNALYTPYFSHCIGTLALLDFVSRAIVVAQASSVRSLTQVSFSWIQAKIYRKLPIHHVSWHFFFLNIHFSHKFSRLFFSFSLTWHPMGAKISKCYSFSSFHPIWAKLYGK